MGNKGVGMKFICDKCGGKKKKIVFLRCLGGDDKEAISCSKCGRIELK
jgi:hypothetical protein